MTGEQDADAEVPAAAPRRPVGRRQSLRRQWLLALAVMLALVVSTGASSLVSSQVVVGKFSASSMALEGAAAYTARLEASVATSINMTHFYMSDVSQGAEKLIGVQRAVEADFTAGAVTLPSVEMRAAVNAAHQSWRAALASVGLLGPEILRYERPGDEGAAHRLLDKGRGEISAKILVIDELARDRLRADLAAAHEFRRLAFALVSGVCAVALLAMLYFARRMSRDVLRPVAALGQGVGRVRDGALNHRVVFSPGQAENELTDLARGFNEMAGELATTHRELTFRATHDSLTGLSNRLALREHLSVQFASAGGRRQRPDVSVLFVDLDDFKVVNDTLGHAGGDELLMQVAGRLSACARSTDIVGRLGGDEFAIIVTADGSRRAAGVADRVLSALSPPFVVQGQALSVSASIGVGTTGPGTTCADELLANADFAMYTAKGQGKQRYEVYDPALHASSTDAAALRSDLRRALEQGELCLDYQPIMEMSSGTIVGVEALLRWNHPTRGLVSPLDFVPLAEQTGDIDGIGLWVLRTATAQLARWRRDSSTHADLWLSVNLSPVQLRNAHVVAELVEVLSRGPVPASAVVLEVTESAVVLGEEGAVDALQTLKDTGARIALDDFGTGVSSLGTLAGLPIDIVKIDRAFVSGQDCGTPSTPVLQTVVSLVEQLGLSVVAEGVENAEQAITLQALGCELGQGYGLARPAAAALVTALLAQTPQVGVPGPR